MNEKQCMILYLFPTFTVLVLGAVVVVVVVVFVVMLSLSVPSCFPTCESNGIPSLSGDSLHLLDL